VDRPRVGRDDGRPEAAVGMISVRVAAAAAGAQLKDWPQPQVFWAFGLSMANPAPWRPSL